MIYQYYFRIVTSTNVVLHLHLQAGYEHLGQHHVPRATKKQLSHMWKNLILPTSSVLLNLKADMIYAYALLLTEEGFYLFLQ